MSDDIAADEEPQCSAEWLNPGSDVHECYRAAGHRGGHICRRCGAVQAEGEQP